MGFIQYLRDVRAEWLHISWPTPRQSLVYTALVIVVALLTSFYLGFLDFGFTHLLETLI